ncbi:hypothetical protein GGS24DRAFT_514825 [Hypoxylon argillaceum]|nr:hypothetical protein GGS24DRAFT_514825 [Hypoxylon argillaceum]
MHIYDYLCSMLSCSTSAEVTSIAGTMSGTLAPEFPSRPVRRDSASDIPISQNGLSDRYPSFFGYAPSRAPQQSSLCLQDDATRLVQVESSLVLGDRSPCSIQEYNPPIDGNTVDDSSYLVPDVLSSTINVPSSSKAKMRAAPFSEKGKTRLEESTSYDEHPHPQRSASTIPSPAVLRLRNAANGEEGRSGETSNRSRRDDSVLGYQQSDHLRLDTKPPKPVSKAAYLIPPEPVAQPGPRNTKPNGRVSSSALSLRGGGSDTEYPESKRPRPESARRHGLLSQPSMPSTTTTTTTITTTTPNNIATIHGIGAGIYNLPALPPRHLNRPPRHRRTTTTTLTITPATTFATLPPHLQLYTRAYLRGEPAAAWTHDLGDAPLMTMFLTLRACALLLCEAESPGLRRVVRDAALYARLRDGLSAHCLEGGDEFVRGVRGENPGFDERLRRPHERMRIVWALETVDFPRMMGEGGGGGGGGGGVGGGDG